MKFLLTIFFLTWSSAFATNRIANATDAATIPNCNIGDYIIDQANGNPDIFINLRGVIAITYPAKILISADINTSYGHDLGNITLNLISCKGYDSTHRGMISFYSTSGRRLVYRGYFRLYHAVGWTVTGEYDPVKKLGSSAYKGWGTNWPFIIGSLGIVNDTKWANTIAIGTVLDSGSSYITFKNIEFTNGGFAPISANGLNGGRDFVGIRITGCLVYNRNGEGTYIGSTSRGSQRSLIGLRYDNNIIFLTGNEGAQFDCLFWDVDIANNVIICGGANFRNSFEEYQDHGVQLTITGNNVRFHHNIVLGGGEMAIQVNYKADQDKTPGNVKNRVYLNVFLGSRGPKGLYTGAFSYGTTAQLDIDSNYWGHFYLPYEYNRTITNKRNTQTVIHSAFSNPSVIVHVHGNKFDLTKTSYIVKSESPGATLDTANNRTAVVPWPQFNNFFGYSFIAADTIHPAKMEIYSGFVGQKFQRSTSDSNNHPTRYQAGWYLSDSSKWYKTKIPTPGTMQPNVTPGWQNYYSKVYWYLTTGKMVLDPVSLKGLTDKPPLDVRIPANSEYGKLKIGLYAQTK